MSTQSERPCRASFHRMEESTREDWMIIAPHHEALCKGLPDRTLAHLRLLDGDYGGFPVDRLTHSLQTAKFCELYDQPAFDPAAETLPLSEFEPMVRRLLGSGTAIVGA